jgi:hypothetical protein
LKKHEVFDYPICTDDEREDLTHLLAPIVDQIASSELRDSITKKAAFWNLTQPITPAEYLGEILCNALDSDEESYHYYSQAEEEEAK